MADSAVSRVLATLLGLNRAGRWLYVTLFVLAVPALAFWLVFLPRMRFSDADERLFRAARHGDRAGVEQALASGARVDDAAPVDGRTALSRAAILGYPDIVQLLLDRGADAAARGNDGRTALDVAASAREAEKDPAGLRDLDAVLAILRPVSPAP